MSDRSSTLRVTTPEPGRAAAEEFVAAHLADLVRDAPIGSDRFRGGQSAADAALAAYDVTGYRRFRNEVLPVERRGASGLSPYIRHGLLPLRRVWDHVAGGPRADVAKFRDELLWQEFARHWYARWGTATATGIRRELESDQSQPGWNREMACVDETLGELERSGWLVNQTRMWLASQWSVRQPRRWQDGEDEFFAHLLDGSRAANRLGWQWTTGVGSSKHYGFSRSQVRKRAPQLCAGCVLRDACPIDDWPDDPNYVAQGSPPSAASPDAFGPDEVDERSDAEVVWLTAESLGGDDPALAANPDVPVVFTFDRALLARLRLSAKRLVFLVESLAELSRLRDLELYVGDPVEALNRRATAVTFAPVPGFVRRVGAIETAALHPWPWLVRPSDASVRSFSAWRRASSSPA